MLSVNTKRTPILISADILISANISMSAGILIWQCLFVFIYGFVSKHKDICQLEGLSVGCKSQLAQTVYPFPTGRGWWGGGRTLVSQEHVREV